MRPAPAITTSPDETFSGAKPASAFAENTLFAGSHFRTQNRLPLLLKMLILPGRIFGRKTGFHFC
jgi:hypothetical protein